MLIKNKKAIKVLKRKNIKWFFYTEVKFPKPPHLSKKVGGFHPEKNG